MTLPLLPLETYRPRWSEAGAYLVVAQDRVLIASVPAREVGVRRGMQRGGAQALCPHAVVFERDAQREEAALHSVALCLLQYTPEVALAGQDSLLMDVTRSLRAFGGLRQLYRRVAAGVADLGFTAQVGMAPTAHGAWLLAQAADLARRIRRRVLRLETLTHQLNRIPYRLLPDALPFDEWLVGIGCKTLGDLRKLPRAGLQRRTDVKLLDALDRAYGEAPEFFSWIEVPETFSAKLELPDRIDHAEGVLFGARRLVLQMIGWLTARHRAVERMVLAMEHERGRQAIPPTRLEMALAEPAWQEEHIVRLLKERLGRIELVAPVIGLRLEATHTTAMEPPSASLFPEPGGTPSDFKRLIELLCARLGDECVLVPSPCADHRPEVCNRWLPATTAKRVPLPVLPGKLRPFWMLEEPIELILRDHRPFYGSPLRVSSEGERVECGWWDGKLVVRDYFVAHGADHAAYWIFRERLGDDIRWYLHGVFA